ncbi:MAG: Gfo/Idh/MocA family oxidoreductase [Pyrinomonadaceae bacterium]|nr:Gfo/Idh/MocA family oxidoreductase [Pyrinomonadaceae bacterium]
MEIAAKRRVVIVGIGSIGRRHARLLCERKDVAVEVFEPSAEMLTRAESELGPLVKHESFEQMLATQPEVVWICTPNPLHAAQTVAALRAGCHVFCEKPMSNSLVEARRMKEAAEASGKILNIGFVLHFLPVLARLKEVISGGVLGQILHVHGRAGMYVILANSASRYQTHEPGSLFLDYSHQPDLFYWLLGRAPKTIQVTAFHAGSLEFSSDPNVADVVCGYDDPLVVTLHINYVQMPQRHDYEVIGDLGWAAVDIVTGELKIGSRNEQSVVVEKYPCEPDDLYRAEIEGFFATVAGERSPETSAADGIISTVVCEKSIEAWRRGERVDLNWQ